MCHHLGPELSKNTITYDRKSSKLPTDSNPNCWHSMPLLYSLHHLSINFSKRKPIQVQITRTLNPLPGIPRSASKNLGDIKCSNQFQWEHRQSNPGLQDEEQKCYLCAMKPLSLSFQTRFFKFYFRRFYNVMQSTMSVKLLSMPGFEPRISGVASNCSANCAATTATLLSNQFCASKVSKLNGIPHSM